jgi:dTDP-4-dehydrorhamnose 3,5-epimerase
MKRASTLIDREVPAVVGEPVGTAVLQASAGPRLIFYETTLRGAWLIDPRPAGDHRGFFLRTFCAREFADRGLQAVFVQHSTSYSSAKGTLRGMHFQRAPHGEVKLVSCLRGAIWDVIIDLRPGSATFMRWEGFLLNEENRRQLYVPEGFAHGFQTLLPDSEVGYLISAFYTPEAASGLRYDDPSFAIPWPLAPAAMSERDRAWPEFSVAGR